MENDIWQFVFDQDGNHAKNANVPSLTDFVTERGHTMDAVPQELFSEWLELAGGLVKINTSKAWTLGKND